MIETINELKDYFFDSKHRLGRFKDSVNVSTKLRKQWLLNRETTIQQGKICSMKFTNKGGGVWKAQLESITDKQYEKESKVNTKQLQGMVKERNIYKKLLDNCVKEFNILLTQRLDELTTEHIYELVSTIEKEMNKFN